MTQQQRIYLMATLWPAACKAQKWSPNDRARRLDVLTRILGRPITTANDVTTNEDFDLIKRELRTLADDLRGPLDNRSEGIGRRQLNIIRTELIPCLALYCGGTAGARKYISEIIQDKFNKARKVELLHLEDLSPYSNLITVRGIPREIPSQISQLLMTLNGRLNGKHGLRNKAGDTLHDMRTAAKIPCGCKLCGGGIARAASDLDASDASTPSESFETASVEQPF